MASTDASPSPKKNVAFRITLPMYDNTGAHLSGGLSSLACKISKDAGTEASSSNTPTEIATNSSKVYLDLTSTEMNADTIAGVITCANTNANPTDFVIYTNSSGKIAVDLDTIKTQAVTASAGVTFPAATLASTSNITGGTITTVTNLTNAPTAGDLTATMKTSISGLTIARVTLVDTITSYTGNTPQTNDIGLFKTTFFSGSNQYVMWCVDDNGNAVAPSATALTAAQVWDLATSGHTTSGTFGAAAVAAGGSGDPWSTSLPGSYGSGTAGNIVGNMLDVAVGSRMATFTLPTHFSTLAIDGSGKVTVGTAPDAVLATSQPNYAPAKAGDAMTLTSPYDAAKTAAPTATEVATEILTIDWTGVTGEASFSTLNALRFVRGAWSVSGSTLTVKKEDGTTTAYTHTLTTDPSAVPITGVS